METVTFDEAIARALEKNPTIAIASTNILRSEAILQQVRASVMPRLGASITNTTLDSGRSFGDDTVQPQNQTVFGLSATAPILAAAQWAARAQAHGSGRDRAPGDDRHAAADRRRDRIGVPRGDRAEAPGRGQPDARSKPRAGNLTTTPGGAKAASAAG